MQYRSIANTALKPSAICLGTGDFGSGMPRDGAFAILDAFAEQGGNFADSAHVYAAWRPDGIGASERTLGAWVKSRGRRQDFIVGTKGAHPLLESMHISRMSPAEITQDLTESLDRLDSDYIDIYWLHRDAPEVPVGEILGVLNEHIAAGRIHEIGASNWSAARLQEAADYAAGHHLRSFCASQVGYSLAQVATGNPAAMPGTLYMDEPMWAFHQKTALPVVAFTSQAMGFFSGKYAANGAGSETPKGQSVAQFYFSPANFTRLERAQALAARLGCTANQINLAYLMSQPFTVIPIVGSRSPEQIRASCAAVQVTLGPADVAWLNAA
jgi:aryl-alcohol dehydrogenase-like predicted oxidoreductase